jgi:hypothetical protein
MINTLRCTTEPMMERDLKFCKTNRRDAICVNEKKWRPALCAAARKMCCAQPRALRRRHQGAAFAGWDSARGVVDSTLLFPLGLFVGQGSLIVHANLRNRALIPNASVSELIQLSTIIIFFVALAEELFVPSSSRSSLSAAVRSWESPSRA